MQIGFVFSNSPSQNAVRSAQYEQIGFVFSKYNHEFTPIYAHFCLFFVSRITQNAVRGTQHERLGLFFTAQNRSKSLK
jgi:hypothetical protein